jgi:hypothetical protein
MRAIESLIKTPLSYTIFLEYISPSLMQLTGAKFKRCYQQPLSVLSAYSYLHKKHVDKIDAISKELNTLLLTHSVSAGLYLSIKSLKPCCTNS